MDPNIDESRRDDLPPKERVVALAEDKARAAAKNADANAPRLIVAADTLVCLCLPNRQANFASAPSVSTSNDGRDTLVLGKPSDRIDAKRMIRLLAGRIHTVHTGLVVLDRTSNRLFSTHSDSFVSFSSMCEEEIEEYLDTGEWDGVAGAYRIQGWTAFFIEKIDGSCSGIMGLPIHELYDILKRANYRFRSLVAD
jgi:septum formation protein